MKKSLSERIIAIDLIRGYFLFVILVDHFGRTFGFYDLFTGGGRQWVSAAEGFFFVSGLMIGLVRGRKLVNQPLKVAAKKVWSRAAQLYLWSIGLTTFFTLAAQPFIQNSGLKPGAFHNESIQHFLYTTLTLNYNYGWADFLAYYAIYLALTPLALWLLRKGHWKILLAINIVAWLFASDLQVAWQLLFFSGTIVGFYLQDIEKWFKGLKNTTKKITGSAIISLGTITIAVSLFMNTIVDIMHRSSNGFNPLGNFTATIYNFNHDHLSSYFDKYTLGIGRVILFYLWFAMLYLIVRKYETKINKLLGWFFVPLGQNSLYVYIVHATALFFIDLYISRVLPIWLNIVLNSLFLGFIWLLVKKKFLFKIIPR